nr:hypothetical protein [Tanacetum cinerariifolium]
HMVMTDMKLLVVEIETADITADDVDNVENSETGSFKMINTLSNL